MVPRMTLVENIISPRVEKVAVGPRRVEESVSRRGRIPGVSIRVVAVPSGEEESGITVGTLEWDIRRSRIPVFNFLSTHVRYPEPCTRHRTGRSR